MISVLALVTRKKLTTKDTKHTKKKESQSNPKIPANII